MKEAFRSKSFEVCADSLGKTELLEQKKIASIRVTEMGYSLSMNANAIPLLKRNMDHDGCVNCSSELDQDKLNNMTLGL